MITVAGPELVMRTAFRANRLQTTVWPAPKSSRPPSFTVIVPYVPAGRSQRPFPGRVSETPSQSVFPWTSTPSSGLHAGSGKATPHAAATSPGSMRQFPSQLGVESPSRSPMRGGVHDWVQSGVAASSPIMSQSGAQFTGSFRNTWWKEPVAHILFATSWPGSGMSAPDARSTPHSQFRPTFTLTVQLGPGDSIARFFSRADLMPRTK
jgi:hypothetical protein